MIKLQRHYCQVKSSHLYSFSCHKEITSSHQATCWHQPPHVWPGCQPLLSAFRSTAQVTSLPQKDCWGAMPPRCSSTAQQFSPSATRNQVPEWGKQRRDSKAAHTTEFSRPPPQESTSGTRPKLGQAAAPSGRAAGPLPALLREGHGRHRRAPPAGPVRMRPQGERSAALGRQRRAPHIAPAHPSALPRPLHSVTAHLGPAAPLGAGASSPARSYARSSETYPRDGPAQAQGNAVTDPFPTALLASRTGTSQPGPHSHLGTTIRLYAAAPARRPTSL